MVKTQRGQSVEGFKDQIVEGLWPLIEPTDMLDTWEANYNQGDVPAVKRSYEEFGQRKPIVARRKEDGRGEVTAGNTQLVAARELGWQHIAVVWVSDDDAKAIAFALADNHTAKLARDDEALLLDALTIVRFNPILLRATSYTEDDLKMLSASTGRTAAQEAAFLEGLTNPNAVGGVPHGDALAVGDGAQLIFTFASRQDREQVTGWLRDYMIANSHPTLAAALLALCSDSEV